MKQRWISGFLFVALAAQLPSCNENPYEQGQILYQNFCANCHMDDGSGLEGLIPPLAGADYYQENVLQTACLIRYGMEGKIVVNGQAFEQPMPGTDKLTEFEITNILNYINTAWYQDLPYVKLADVRNTLKECEQ
ncbi:MAG: cytochrome c [Saprospiraceae bacterium]